MPQTDGGSVGLGGGMIWGLAVLDPSHPPPKSHTAGRASSGTRLRTLANPSGTRFVIIQKQQHPAGRVTRRVLS